MPNGANEVIEEFIDGKMYQFDNYRAYVPDNYTKDTPIVYYVCGDGGYYLNNVDFDNIHNRLTMGNLDAIVIQVPRNKAGGHLYQSAANANEYVMDIINNLNLSGNYVISTSHSGGTAEAMNAATKLLTSDNSPSMVHCVLDGYIAECDWDSKGYTSAANGNQSIFLLFGQDRGTNNNNHYYLFASRTNAIIFKEPGRGHEGINNSFTELGVLDFLVGNSSLNLSQFGEITAYRGGIPTELRGDEFQSLKDLYAFFGFDYSKVQRGMISNARLSSEEMYDAGGYKYLSHLKNYEIQSDDDFVTAAVNDVLTRVKGMSFLSGVSYGSYSSSTKVPSEVSSKINKFFNKTAATIEELVQTLENIYLESEAIKNIDTEFENKAKELSDETNDKTKLSLLTKTSDTAEDSNNKGKVTKTDNPLSSTPKTKTEYPHEKKYDNNSTKTYTSEKKEITDTSAPVPIENSVSDNEIENIVIDFDQLKSDENRIVYQINDTYKLVLNIKNGEVTSIEHYYKYANANDALKNISIIKDNYKNIDGFKDVFGNKETVKIVMDLKFNLESAMNSLSGYIHI